MIGLSSPVVPGAQLRVLVVLISLAIGMPASSLAQDDGLSLLPPLWDDDGLDQGVGGQRPGEDGHGAAGEPVVPGVAGTEDVVPVDAEEGLSQAAGQERTEPAPAPAPEDAGISAGVGEQREGLEPPGSSSLLGYLDERDEAPPVLVVAPGGVDAGAALFGCPRSVLERLLRGATAREDVVSSLEIEREVLTLCGERQRLVVEILQAEAELAGLWRDSRAPAPEVRAEPVDVLAQLTEFAGAEVVAFDEEPVEPEPEPEAEAEPEPEPEPRYGWAAIFGTSGDLQARVSDGAEVWFVRVGDQLPGGVVIDWIAVSPPGVHVVKGGHVDLLPFRPAHGGGG